MGREDAKTPVRLRFWRNRTGVYVVFIAYRAALAFSQSAVNAAGSAMAISESIFRFMTMPAFLRPFMKRE